jgi:hypothetical protein
MEIVRIFCIFLHIVSNLRHIRKFCICSNPDIDEMPTELSNIKSRLASLNNDGVSLERLTRELSSSISRLSIDDVWTGVYSLQKQLLAMLRSIDDLLEHTPLDYAQNFQVLEDQVDGIAALLWGLMRNLGNHLDNFHKLEIVSLVTQGKVQEAAALFKTESDLYEMNHYTI